MNDNDAFGCFAMSVDDRAAGDKPANANNDGSNHG